MFQLFLGSLLLSVIHASIPNHWLPVVAIGRAERWTIRETLVVAAISGLAHTLSTVIIGVFIGSIGITLGSNYAVITEKIAPMVLISIGIIYIMIDLFRSPGHNHDIDTGKVNTRSKWAIVISLALAMFLSPCLEIEAYYFQAAAAGWEGILLVSAVYVLVTVTGMLLLTYLASKGVRAIRSHFLEHHEKLLSGIVLVILGIFALFIHF